MRELNAIDLADMLKRCGEHNNYTGVIVFDKAERKRNFAQEMQILVDSGQVPDALSISRYGHIKFKNGSVIRTVSSNERTMVGIKANEALFDNVEKTIRDIVKENLVPYYINGEEVVFEQNTDDTLDDFLDGFNII